MRPHLDHIHSRRDCNLSWPFVIDLSRKLGHQRIQAQSRLRDCFQCVPKTCMVRGKDQPVTKVRFQRVVRIRAQSVTRVTV